MDKRASGYFCSRRCPRPSYRHMMCPILDRKRVSIEVTRCIYQGEGYVPARCKTRRPMGRTTVVELNITTHYLCSQNMSRLSSHAKLARVLKKQSHEAVAKNFAGVRSTVLTCSENQWPAEPTGFVRWALSGSSKPPHHFSSNSTQHIYEGESGFQGV